MTGKYPSNLNMMKCFKKEGRRRPRRRRFLKATSRVRSRAEVGNWHWNSHYNRSTGNTPKGAHDTWRWQKVGNLCREHLVLQTTLQVALNSVIFSPQQTHAILHIPGRAAISKEIDKIFDCVIRMWLRPQATEYGTRSTNTSRPQAHHMHNTCTTHAQHMHTTCTPHAHHMHNTGTVSQAIVQWSSLAGMSHTVDMDEPYTGSTSRAPQDTHGTRCSLHSGSMDRWSTFVILFDTC